MRISPPTELVIEGFQRSGNTFAVAAFELAQSRTVTLAHHTHASAQVLTAAARGLPTILTVRRPIDAIVSHCQYYAEVSMTTALVTYVVYYSRCLAVRDKVVVASFEQITSDMGEVIDRANEAFGTSFDRFDHTEENVARCFEVIGGQVQEARFGATREMVLPVPNAAREAQRPELRRRYERLPRLLRRRADELYSRYRGVRVLYIAGWGRSGTTLVGRALGEVEGIVWVGELRNLWGRGLNGWPCGCGELVAECPFWTEALRMAFGDGDRPDLTAMQRLQRKVTRTRQVRRVRRRPDAPAVREYAEVMGSLYRAVGELTGKEVVIDSSKDPADTLVASTIPDVELSVLHVGARSESGGLFLVAAHALSGTPGRGADAPPRRRGQLGPLAGLEHGHRVGASPGCGRQIPPAQIRGPRK